MLGGILRKLESTCFLWFNSPDFETPRTWNDGDGGDEGWGSGPGRAAACDLWTPVDKSIESRSVRSVKAKERAFMAVYCKIQRKRNGIFVCVVGKWLKRKIVDLVFNGLIPKFCCFYKRVQPTHMEWLSWTVGFFFFFFKYKQNINFLLINLI